MNKELIDDDFKALMHVLVERYSILGEREARHRINNLENIYATMLKEEKVSRRYYELSHEIRALELFSNMGDLKVAADSKGEPGADLIYNETLIECTVASSGEEHNHDALVRCGYKNNDEVIALEKSKELDKQISLRILSTLKSKADKCNDEKTKHKKSDFISTEKPYCIFVSLGELALDWRPGAFCMNANVFLNGMGDKVVFLEENSGKQVGKPTYGYIGYGTDGVHERKNNTDKPVDNFFELECNRSISAVIITAAQCGEAYSEENTVIFTNPIAIRKVDMSRFGGLPYWEADSYLEYKLKIRGKEQELFKQLPRTIW
jgi:hypothetical protein